jgi:hypothetical protein
MGDIQQDPSMEEILASIKRVIREDGRVPSQAARSVPRRNGRSEPVPPAPPVPPEEDVLELDDPDDGPPTTADLRPCKLRRAGSRWRRFPRCARHRLLRLPMAGRWNVVRDMLRPMLKEAREHLPQNR